MKKLMNMSKDALSDLFALALELVERLCKWFLKWYYEEK